jgi:flagellar M-ring protein FliF
VRLAMLALVAAASIGFFGFIGTRIATPGYGLLFGDLDTKDSGEIVQKLEAMNTPYQLKGDGTEIMVPTDQVTRVRMLLADDGLPHGGSVGYEIFDKSNAFGTSSFVENIDQVRALEGELARTISSLDAVQSARVHLVLPQREIFTRERANSSASIVVKMRGAGELSKMQVASIQHLVASAVPDLTPERVSVIDTEGNLLASGNGDSNALVGSSAEELRVDYENRTSRKIEELIERAIGPGKARVDVHADMDFDQVTTNSETYDPNGQVVRSTQTVTDTNNSSQGGTAQPVSVSNNLPNAPTAPSAANNPEQSRGSHDEETVNYEISKTVRNQVSEAGQVKRVSVAVVIDGNYVTGADGKKTYQPRTPVEMKNITSLVQSAIGYDQKRGDTVDVVNMRFAPVDEPQAAAPNTVMGFERSDLMHMGETLILALVAVLVILLVIRPLMNRLFDGIPAGVAGPVGLLGRPGATAALMAPGASAAAASGSASTAMALAQQRAAQHAADTDAMIDIGQVDGRVAASSLRKVSEIVDKHPEEALAIVRSWMYQDNR